MSTEQELPQYHVLNFFYDNDDACALTALVHHVRYHVIVEPSKFTDRSTEGKRIAQEYRTLLQHVKEKEEAEAEELEQQDSQTRSTDPDSHSTHDSGIDLSTTTSPKPTRKPTQDPRTLLNDWILTPLIPTFSSHPPPPSPRRDRTVQKWYFSATNFYSLSPSPSPSGHLTPEPLPPSPSLSSRMRRLLPSLTLPKYLLSLGIRTVPASDLCIRAESAEPDPIHPALVREKSTGEDFFLKVVDPSQLGPTKREIRIMKEVEARGLHERIRMPLVRGLVSFDEEGEEGGVGGKRGDGRRIMGFLMDVIEEPTPLTLMLDKEVAREKGEGWAREAERMVGVLHENGIVWGDAKGDNFMVDRWDDLWIIDFGGSYTPGWIDPELKETEEGDDQGVTRLVNGLLDPEGGTVGGDEGGGEGVQHEGDDEEESVSKKRKASEVGLDEEGSSAVKQRKRDVEDGSNMCICDGPESGKMIGCDGEDCKIEWFHMSCVGLDEAPEGRWYCDGCKSE